MELVARLTPPSRVRDWAPMLFTGALFAAIGCVPFVTSDSYTLFLLTFAGVYVLAAMGFNMLVGYTGIISLAHGAMICLGAYTTAILTVKFGWSFWPSALASIIIAAVASMIVCLPALRLSSWYFVLITIAFTLAVTALLTDLRAITGGFSGIVGVPMPSLLGYTFNPMAMYWLVFGLNCLVWWVSNNITRSGIGLSLMAVRDSAICAHANGVSTVHARLFAFVFAGAVAGLAGALFASLKIVVTPEDFSFDFSNFFLFVVILGGAARPSGPLLGVIAFYILPELLGGLREYRMIIYGSGLLISSVFLPEGIAGGLAALWRRHGFRTATTQRVVSAPVLANARASETVESVSLEISNVSKAFGGVRAVNQVSISVPAGHIHAIVGPNGSGKTTLLNLISGLYRTDSGSINLGGTELVGAASNRIARLGVRRTFQTPKLLSAVSVLDNVRFGAYDRETSTGIETALSLPRARRARALVDRQTHELLAMVGLGEHWDVRADHLPHGQQRLVEIARALIGRPRLLLLDEPAAGLSLGELERLKLLTLEIRRLGVTLIMVEHHVELVMGVAQAVTVLDGGQVLASGKPDDVFRDAAVIQAYTGERR